MSAAIASRAGPSFQPFQCNICERRFTRQENLKRHSERHNCPQDGPSIPCEYCPTTFSRQDLRRRHLKRKHPEVQDVNFNEAQQSQGRLAVAAEGSDKERYSDGKSVSRSPMERLSRSLPSQMMEGPSDFDMSIGSWDIITDIQQQHAPVLEQQDQQHDRRKRRRRADESNVSYDADNRTFFSHPQNSTLSGNGHSLQYLIDLTDLVTSDTLTSNQTFPDVAVNDGSTFRSAISPKDLQYLEENWLPSPTQIARGIDLFFSNVYHCFPFIHRPTFDSSNVAPHLLLSMLCIAFQHGEDPDCNDQGGSGAELSRHCFGRARVLVDYNEDKCESSTDKLVIVQAYLLLQVHAMMYLCGQDSAYALKVHPRMVGLARSGGLMQAMQTKSSATEDLESLWREFIKIESHKRTLLAVYQIDALWYQILSIPRSLSHLEIKHDLPCPEECWTSESAAGWAHRRLSATRSVPSVRYSEAIRRFLSPDPDTDSLPIFDPYGAINITHFLLSSVREVSGWSTMTGRVSLERFEPLKLSLDALEPLIRPQSETKMGQHAVSVEATWEMAMIELQSWSPSHTGGIIEGSLDAALATATYLATSCEFMSYDATAKAVAPHTNWFLTYLDQTTKEAESEPPWVTIYAFKAFLIVWQLVRGGTQGVMQVVGVEDGDLDGAMIWARKVFQRRERRQLGKLIMSNLDSLTEIGE